MVCGHFLSTAVGSFDYQHLRLPHIWLGFMALNSIRLAASCHWQSKWGLYWLLDARCFGILLRTLAIYWLILLRKIKNYCIPLRPWGTRNIIDPWHTLMPSLSGGYSNSTSNKKSYSIFGCLESFFDTFIQFDYSVSVCVIRYLQVVKETMHTTMGQCLVNIDILKITSRGLCHVSNFSTRHILTGTFS